MSRCFPYSLPVYEREEKSLTQSIKLQKELEATKEKRKEKRKEKERKEKREKSKDKHQTSKHREHGHKKRKHIERNNLETRDDYKKTTAADLIEQIEKSGLTEEHRVSCHPTQEPCESSESTQNSSKNRKLEATNVNGCYSHGNTILRLKISLQKHKYSKQTPVKKVPCFPSRTTSKYAEATLANEEPCFSGRGSEAPMDQEMFVIAHGQSSSKIKSTNTIEAPTNQNLCGNPHAESFAMIKSNKTTEAPKELVDHSLSHSSSNSKSHRRAEKLERKFRDLIGNWKPAPFLLDAEADTENQGWLFEHPLKSCVNSDAQSCGINRTGEDFNFSFQPRACYMPELEMYQLPYAVPF